MKAKAMPQNDSQAAAFAAPETKAASSVKSAAESQTPVLRNRRAIGAVSVDTDGQMKNPNGYRRNANRMIESNGCECVWRIDNPVHPFTLSGAPTVGHWDSRGCPIHGDRK